MQKWEYDAWCPDPSLGGSSIRDELERRGRDGWELVATPVWDFDPETSRRQLVWILKRPVGVDPADETPQVTVAGTRHEPSDVEGNTAVAAVNELIWKVEADLVAIKRQRLVADDESKKSLTTHLEVELHLLRQSRAWVRSEADLAWVQSGLEAWKAACGLRQQRRLKWLPRLWDGRRARTPRVTLPAVDDVTDTDELRRLLEQTKGRKIGFLLAQECAAALIARDPSRTDREIEQLLKRVAGRKVIGRTTIGVLRKRMERGGVIPVHDEQRHSRASLQPAHD